MTDVNEYFLIRPDWAGSVLFYKRWRTGVQRTIVDGEKCSALFTWPRRTLSYDTVAVEYSETAYIKRKIYKNLHNVWGIPYWQDRTVLTVEAANGQAVLNVASTQYRNFEIGGQCVLLLDQNSYEIGTIQNFTVDQVTLSANLADTWPVGIEVYPILKCRIRTEQGFNLLSAQVGKIHIEAKEEYDEIIRHIPNIDDFLIYEDWPVFDVLLNWGETVRVSFLHDYEGLSFLGKTCSLFHWDETAFRFDAEYLIFGKAEIQRLLDFFDVHQGRWGKFWYSTEVSDVVITAPFVLGAVELTIEPIEYPSYWLGQRSGSYIKLLWPDGTFTCHSVVLASADTITIDPAVDKGCTAEQLSYLLVSFLTLCRFSQDEIEMEYLSNSVANTKLSCRTTLIDVAVTTTTTI